VYALVEAAKKAGVTSDAAAEDICDAMIAAMQEIQVTGLTGTMTWSANGEVDKVPTAMVIKDGAYVGLGN
jgi:branched-chain amino acid transport system substrate-binding protein